MAERDLLVVALAREVLGPRGGPREVLRANEDPVDEYITGVLAPFSAASVSLDGESEALDGGTSGGEDASDPGGPVSAPSGVDLSQLPSPALDPRARPSSLGLSFELEADADPAISICCTWARYVAEAGSGDWTRQPAGEVWERVACDKSWHQESSVDGGVSVHVRSSHREGRWRVSVFLVNRTFVSGPHPVTEDHVFQPEIRVCCGPGTRLVPFSETRASIDDEERSLSLVYRDKPALARGHLCAATWREVDAQRPHPTAQAPEAAPFTWVDGAEVLPAGVFARFRHPDVRTEYVPVVAVNAPDMGWSGFGATPELDPEVLSNLWHADDLRAALEPLVSGYEHWVNEQAQALPALEPHHQAQAAKHLGQCRQTLQRIREGIELVCRDEDARLSFCFANRAMATQSAWSRGSAVPWRPFQLAFQLVNLAGVFQPEHPDRSLCDLLWFPTGGGKTEAYLGLMAFAMAARRLRARRSGDVLGGGGVTVLSRYTLRLLTIQQFRRAVAMVTACELLRVQHVDNQRGWRPPACSDDTDLLWGGTRFSTGLWVGESVSPTGLHDFSYKTSSGELVRVTGAISRLEGRAESDGDSEPAQVLNCPACRATLAIPPEGFPRGGEAVLHLVFGDVSILQAPDPAQLSRDPFRVVGSDLFKHENAAFATLSIRMNLDENAVPESVDRWVEEVVMPVLGPTAWLVPARGSRPGYFVRTAPWGRDPSRAVDFEVFCPDAACRLNRSVSWFEETPAGQWEGVQAFLDADGISTRCPISAWTVDDQVYHRCPTVVIATVDKLARLAFEPRAGALFGNVDRYSPVLGFYRSWCAPRGPSGLPERPRELAPGPSSTVVARFAPPELILQDELHLVEGPLGSMVGLYETAVEALSSSAPQGVLTRPKYVASTATVRQAADQVTSLFDRSLAVFPPPALAAADSFFARYGNPHPLDAAARGRLYVGVCAPGRGGQTPVRNIWARLLQHVSDRAEVGTDDRDLDPFSTLVGYFNANRELAGAVALARQDIPQRLGDLSSNPRRLDEDDVVNLSSRADSLELPGILDRLQVGLGPGRAPVTLAVATSMFGTGVDVERLGLMVVHGQPKTTSAYIQATGRVGRGTGGLVVTLFSAARPRDLNHYEYFTSYHQALYRYVEPITVHPFAPRARDRALGPVSVAMLRQASCFHGAGNVVPVHERWRAQQRLTGRGGDWYCRAHEMQAARTDPDVMLVPEILEARAQGQPNSRRPAVGEAGDHSRAALDRWAQLAAVVRDRLLYAESTVAHAARRPIVLGDPAHLMAGFLVAYENAPNSLREVEPTLTLGGWR